MAGNVRLSVARAQVHGKGDKRVRNVQAAKDRNCSAYSLSPPLTPGQPFARLLSRADFSMTTFHSSLESEGDCPSSASQAKWSEQMPQAILFPANKPSSRADASVLNQWLTRALENYAKRTIHSDLRVEDLNKAIEELVPILSIGFNELVRQVTQQCLERGVVLEKIWCTYVELFETTLVGTRATLRKQKEKSRRVEAELLRTRKYVAQLREEHPKQIKKLMVSLESKFTQRQEDAQEQLRSLNAVNVSLQKQMRLFGSSVMAWFPHFEMYRSAMGKAGLQTTSHPSGDSPEAYIAADFHRILSGMPSESRRCIGYYISSLLGIRTDNIVPDSVEALTDVRDHNLWKIEQLEAKLEDLKRAGPASSRTLPPSRSPVGGASANDT